MQPITVILLNKTNPHNTMKSIIDLPQQIIVGTFSPLTIENRKVAVVDLKHNNYSEALNHLQDLARTDWILYIKDNETLLQGDYLESLLLRPDEIYGFQILQDDVILKEARLWNKKAQKVIFKNPVFEKPNVDPTKIVDVMLYQHKIDDTNILKKLDAWKKSMPLSVDAAYYKAFAALGAKNFIEFKRIVAHYLFNINKADIPSVMARYYLALVQGVVEDNTNEAIKNIVICLSENVLMAEFWCLLGDIFVKAENFGHAIEFYENALLLGSRRLKSDFWPMQISKYDAYPKEMIEKCKRAMDTAKTYSNV